MKAWRPEIRIFFLLFFAFFASSALYFGISDAEVVTRIPGVDIRLAGPIAGFAALLFVFKWMGLFELGMPAEHVDDRPLDRLSEEELEEQKDEILKVLRKPERRLEQIERVLAGFKAGSTPQEAYERGGMREVRRPGRS